MPRGRAPGKGRKNNPAAKQGLPHIYWDQASVPVQIGLLDPAGLPVVGAESARRVLDPKLPARRF